MGNSGLFHENPQKKNWPPRKKVTTQSIARLLTKNYPEGHKSEQGRTITLVDQENRDPDRGDPRVAKRFLIPQSDL
jgi:hypothetical protein